MNGCMNMKILLTGAFGYSEKQLECLEKSGLELYFHKQEKDKVEDPGKYDVVVCNELFLYNDIKEFKNLKYIQLTSAGLDRVPLGYIKERGIEIHNARGVYSIPMAEWAALKVLEIYKDSRGFYKNQKKHGWTKNRNILELFGKNVAIIGCGNIGMEVAKRFKAFGTNIIGVDIVKPCSDYIDEYMNINEIDGALEKSDIVILTLPLTDETYHLFDKARFAHIKRGSVIVNISRGAVICEDDLIGALKHSRLSAAALDVFEEEPLSDESELWDMKNAIITPHNSFVGEGNPDRMFKVIYKNLQDWLSAIYEQ